MKQSFRRGKGFPNGVWEPEQRTAEKRKTPPESWPGWLRFRWSSPLDQDGVDFPGVMSNLLGMDLIVGNCARLRLFLFLFVVRVVIILRTQIIIRCHCRQIMLLQFFVTLPHFRRHLVEIFLGLDRAAE